MPCLGILTVKQYYGLCVWLQLLWLQFVVSHVFINVFIVSCEQRQFTVGLQVHPGVGGRGSESHPIGLPAYLHPITHPLTYLPTYLLPALCCPHKKRLREAEDNGPSMCPSCRWPALREMLSLPFSIPLSRSLISLCSRRVMGKPAKRWILLCLCE